MKGQANAISFLNRTMLRRQKFVMVLIFRLRQKAKHDLNTENRVTCQKGKWKVVGYGNNQTCSSFQALPGTG